MNKRGSVFFGIAIFLIIFFAGILIIPFFTDTIDETRINLDCTNVSISDGTKLTCLGIDAFIPYFIWFIVSTSLGIFAGANK